jgi:hypothetical protein
MNIFQELESDIINDLGGHFRDVALALLQTPQDFVAENIHMNLKVWTRPLCVMNIMKGTYGCLLVCPT